MVKDKQPEKTKNYGGLIALGIILSIIAIIYLYSSYSNSYVSSSNNQDYSKNSIVNQIRCEDIQVEYTETVPYTDQECVEKNLAYAIENTKWDYSTCNKQEDLCVKYFLGVCSEKKTYCVDKTVSCSLTLKNLDAEQAGSFTIKHLFYEKNTKELIDSVSNSRYVYAQSSQQIQGVLRLTSEGENGIANEDIGSCNYQVEYVPTKTVCKDVIRYKDVTRYRTEQRCN